MYRKRYGFGKFRRKRQYRRYNKYKSKFGRFRSGGRYRGLYKSFRRYKKFKRSGFRFAQKRYQITKYRIPNVVIPDELVMTFKWNAAYAITTNSDRIVTPAFGMDPYFFDQVSGWKENSENFDTVEFLHGKLSISYYNTAQTSIVHQTGSTLGGVFESPAFIGMIPQRTWLDEIGIDASEKVPAVPANATDFYQGISEYPGYKMKVVNGQSSGKYVKGFKTSFGQKSWKNLKADRTGFQVSLPIAKPPNPGTFVPQNFAVTNFDYFSHAPTRISTPNLSFTNVVRPMVLAKYKFTVRFKGKKLIAPV